MIKHLTFFDNGNVAAFDEKGSQMPEIQRVNIIERRIQELCRLKLISKDTVIHAHDWPSEGSWWLDREIEF